MAAALFVSLISSEFMWKLSPSSDQFVIQGLVIVSLVTNINIAKDKTALQCFFFNFWRTCPFCDVTDTPVLSFW